MNDATKAIITALITDELVKPLLAKVREHAQPVLDLLPDPLEEVALAQATKALGTFATNMIVEALELLFKRGVIDVTTEGRIVLQPHAGAHPDDR